MAIHFLMSLGFCGMLFLFNGCGHKSTIYMGEGDAQIGTDADSDRPLDDADSVVEDGDHHFQDSDSDSDSDRDVYDSDVDTDPTFVFDIGTRHVYVITKNEWYETTTLSPVTGDAALSQYGGDLSTNVGGTGLFRTQTIDGNWYFIDPDGYPFISLGLNSVKVGGGISLPEELMDIGLNSLGNWSDYEAINSDMVKIPYVARFNFLLGFKNDDRYDGGTNYLEDLFKVGVLPVVFPDFDEFCEEFAEQIAVLKNDPWLIGIFSDNELMFYNGSPSMGDVLDRWIALDTTDPYYQYAEQWLADRGSRVYNYNRADKNAFAAHIVSVYYTKVSQAIKRNDPNHLYLGTRFHGAAKHQSYIFEAAGPHVDVISVNYYGDWTPSAKNMDMWLSSGKKPFIITEFYVKGEDSGLENIDGAGWEVRTQTDRGLFYTQWLLNFYSHPGAIGTHWHAYRDFSSNKGFLSNQCEWHVPLIAEVHNTNRQIYKLVKFLRNKTAMAAAYSAVSLSRYLPVSSSRTPTWNSTSA